MTSYIIKRLMQSIIVIIGVLLIVFTLIRLSGDPVFLLLPPEASFEDIQRLRAQLGLDRPIYVQFYIFLSSAIQGDLGYSFFFHRPALTVVLSRVPATLQLATLSICITLVIALPLGIIAALRRDSWVDRFSMSLSLFGQSMPTFWFAIVLILIFSILLGWFPAFGRGSIRHLILPSVTLGFYNAAIITQLLRSSLLEVLNKNYIRTAYAKGLAFRIVLVRHAIKNASLPVITMLGLQFSNLMGGAIITETVFAYPGLGNLVISSIYRRDFPVVQAFVVVISLVIVYVNLLVDILYTILDPRIKYK